MGASYTRTFTVSLLLCMDDTATNDTAVATPAPAPSTRDWRFWLVFVSIALSLFVSALELSAVSTALPVIVNALGGKDFVWIGSAYALAATAFIPLSGGLAQIFGRRIIMLASLLIFAVGSALCGAASSMEFLIAGRTVQGLGGGGIAALTQIILSDLVPLHERGLFNGIIGIAWGVANGIGPVVGGSLADTGNWRWLFYMNLPICGVAAVFVLLFLRLRTPEGSLKEKASKIDYVGNAIVVASTTSCVVALTWSGITYSWGSFRVLVPFILGLVGLVGFFLYEAFIPGHPVVPFHLMSTRTGVSGYVQTFLTSFTLLGVIYYLPVYFQACKGASPIASGVDCFGLALVSAPCGITAGLTVAKSRHYRPQLWFAWALILIGTGLLSTLTADSSRAAGIGYVVPIGVGIGILTTTTYFPVLAPLPVSSNGLAVSLFTFFRNFAQIWGVSVGGSVLQNELRKRLSDEFLRSFPQGTAIAYSVIPLISGMDEALRQDVRTAFADSLRVVWQVLIGVAGIGFLSSLAMKHLPLHTNTDENWGLEERKGEASSDV